VQHIGAGHGIHQLTRELLWVADAGGGKGQLSAIYIGRILKSEPSPSASG
jgi:hypothetical protein